MDDDAMIDHPELGIEDDGEISVDWMTPKRDMLSLSIRDDGRVCYAILLNDRSESGVIHLPANAFYVLKQLVNDK
jgi:hypothetical protein